MCNATLKIREKRSIGKMDIALEKKRRSREEKRRRKRGRAVEEQNSTEGKEVEHIFLEHTQPPQETQDNAENSATWRKMRRQKGGGKGLLRIVQEEQIPGDLSVHKEEDGGGGGGGGEDENLTYRCKSDGRAGCGTLGGSSRCRNQRCSCRSVRSRPGPQDTRSDLHQRVRQS